MKHPYGIGLDIGIASVGWAVVAMNENAEPYGLIRCGSRIFDKAEQPKTGESLAAPRREARSTRRRLRRRSLRKADLYELMAQNGLPGRAEIEEAVQAGHLPDIYALRVQALDGPVTAMDFARILLHLMQRRGFRSNRKADDAQKDGKLLQAIDANTRRMEENHYRTVGEMMYRDPVFAEHKRNKSENYLSTVRRDQIVEEAVQLFAAQRQYGAAWASPEMEAEYLTILTRQRSFDEGPGGNSPYGGNIVEKMVGTCTLEGQAEPRAAKATWSFEYFTLLQKINHIRIIESGAARILTAEERQELLSVCYQTDKLDFARIRKALALSEQARFNMVRYRDGQTTEDCEKKEKIVCLPCYHKMRKVLNTLRKDYIRSVSRDRLDAAATALTMYKNEATLRAKLEEAQFEPLEVDALMTLPSFSGFGHISVKACRKLIPYLEQGLNYNDACKEAGYDFQGNYRGEKSQFLPASTEEMEDITSPVVRRAVAQTIKVVNAIIREQGESPVNIHLELAREMSKNFQQRNDLDKAMKDNNAENERLMKDLHELFPGKNITGQDLVKYRLWKEQDGRCAYSLQPLELEKAITVSGYAEVDHIVPYSISFDDRRANKVLVLASENRQKGNRLPLQYLQGKRRDDFIVYTKASVKNYRKRQNLLKEKLSEEDSKGFMQRNLQDTQYIASFMLNYIRSHLAFADFPAAGKKRVVAVNGAVTAFLRKRWGLGKVRADGDLHHAVDAAVIACTTDGMIQRVSRFYTHIETSDTRGERFPEPWPRFRDELMQRLSACPQENLMQINPVYYQNVDIASIRPVFVSRMPRHKMTGAAHKETIKGRLDDAHTVQRRSITDLKLDKEGEIAGYFNPSSDTLLYNALKEQLTAFGGDGKKAFAEPFFKPRADGTPGAQVRKVKVYDKATSMVAVHEGKGVADNDTMVRIDVYFVPGDGYYWVPIYVADTVKPELPNKAVVQGKSYAEWKEMDEKNFLFSLCQNDLIYLERKSAIKFKVKNSESTLEKEIVRNKGIVYFEGGDISTAAISITTPEDAYFSRGLGFKTLQKVQKYQVDVLGNYTLVKKEKRQNFPAQRR